MKLISGDEVIHYRRNCLQGDEINCLSISDESIHCSVMSNDELKKYWLH